MTNAATAPPAPPGTGVRPPPASPLRYVRRAGYFLLGLELAGFLAWSTVVYNRFALTFDYAQYSQAWQQIAHGNLNPYDGMHGLAFWQNNGEFIMWPLALLYWVWPHGITLLWLQDIATVAAQAVAFTWVCQVAAGRGTTTRMAALLAGAGCFLLIGVPWIFLSVTNDFHFEPIAAPLAALLALDLTNGRRRASIWLPLLLLCGDVAASYAVGIGIGAAVSYRGRRRRGVITACAGVAYILFLMLIHANLGSGNGFQGFAYLAGAARAHSEPLGPAALLAGIAAHPLTMLKVLYAKRVDVLANICPSGLLGLGFPPLLPFIAVVVGVNTLYPSNEFAQPSFQTLPVYVLMPMGTVAVLGWLMRRHPRSALVLGSLVLAQTLAWAAVWAPRLPATWLRTPAVAAAVLSRMEARIPRSAEVVASSGVMGRFSDRAHLYMLFYGPRIPVHGETWFIVAPMIGIESQDTAHAMAFIRQLAGPMHAILVTHSGGVWVFRWRPPPGLHFLELTQAPDSLPVWAGLTPNSGTARAVLSGPMRRWHTTMSRGHGYVADGLAWLKPPGRYRAYLTMSASGPVNVEVWNDTGNVLLTRHVIFGTAGIRHFVLPVDATTAYPNLTYSGWGPFRAYFLPPLPGNRLEIRVWKLAGGTVNVYQASLAGPCRGSETIGC